MTDQASDPKIEKKRRDAAARQQRRRDRLKRGKCIVPVEIDRGEMADDLVDLGLLSEWDAESDLALRAALDRALKILRRHA